MSDSPMALARKTADFVYGALRRNPNDYLGLSGSRPLRNDVLLFVEGFDPTISLEKQLKQVQRAHRAMTRMTADQQVVAQDAAFALHVENSRANQKLFGDLVRLIDRGADLQVLRSRIAEYQCWPCYAIVTTRDELQQAMAERHQFGRCEVDFQGHIIGESVLITVRMIAHEWK